MSNAARSAPTCASPTIPAATGIAPKCQAAAAKEWLADRQAELLPVAYFHVVFTLPRPIADIAYHNKAVVYDLLLKTAAETLITIAPTGQARGLKAHVRQRSIADMTLSWPRLTWPA